MPKNALGDRMRAKLSSRKERNILRKLTALPELVDFSSNDYLSLAHNTRLRAHFLSELAASDRVLGSGGSRLLDGNTPEHVRLETRLAKFFRAPSALLFNSGFDANVGFFSCIPQQGDAILYDSYIHASVHDGMRASRVRADSLLPFDHNSIESLRGLVALLLDRSPALRDGSACIFIAVESLYSMDGDFAPLAEIVQMVDELLPLGNGHIVVDEAHSTGLYGPNGRGLVALLGLEDRIAVRLHTFGKSLASSGAVILTSTLMREYLVNYARTLIYTTALANSNVIAIRCSFDMLEDGTATELSSNVLALCAHLLASLRYRTLHIPPKLLSLSDLDPNLPNTPSPIIPILTPHARALAVYLQRCGFLARPITHPTVPRGLERVRVCVHAGNSVTEVDGLVAAVVRWAEGYREEDKKALQVTAKL